jgi:hypothetical protein
MSRICLSAWTHDVDAIPVVRWLAVPEPCHGDRLEVFDGRRRPRSESPKVLWYRITFWVSSWLVGGVPDSDDDATPPEACAEDERPGDGPDAGRNNNRCRRRHAPRRRRRREGRGGPVDDAPTTNVAAPPVCAPSSSASAVAERWLPRPCSSVSVAGVSPAAHDVSPSRVGMLLRVVPHEVASVRGSPAVRVDECPGSACSIVVRVCAKVSPSHLLVNGAVHPCPPPALPRGRPQLARPPPPFWSGTKTPSTPHKLSFLGAGCSLRWGRTHPPCLLHLLWASCCMFGA